jgi:hypothetical protein
MRPKGVLTLEALLMGLIVEIGNSSYRLDGEYDLCLECRHFDCENKSWQAWLKTDCSLSCFLQMCQTEMTDEQFWGLVGDVGLNKLEERG